MRKYRVIEIATAIGKEYAVERKVLWFMWMQVDALNNVVLHLRTGLYSSYEEAFDAMQRFKMRDQYNSDLKNNRRAI